MNIRKNDINRIVNNLIIYDNVNNLSWNKAYKDILKHLNMDDKIDDVVLLSNVVKEITKLGYDIMDNPFRLEKYI